MFVKLILLCKELSEYALEVEKIVFDPKYIVVHGTRKRIQFLYAFADEGAKNAGIERLLECCIENLDYKDEELVKKF